MVFLHFVLIFKVPEVLIQDNVLLQQFLVLFPQIIHISMPALVVLVVELVDVYVFFLVRARSLAHGP